MGDFGAARSHHMFRGLRRAEHPRLCMGRLSANRVLKSHALLIVFAASIITSLLDLALAAERARDGLIATGSGSTTIEQALGLAYRNNPQLDAQRSATRAIDENVPTALAGYRPRVTGT